MSGLLDSRKSAIALAVVAVALMVLSVALPSLGVLLSAPAAPASPATPSAGSASATPSAGSASTLSTATPTTTVPSTPTSPHPGILDIYEVAPQGASTEDPAIAYDTVSYEPILNVYQTLISYNGSSTSSLVPELASCVPGSSQCSNLYGSTGVLGAKNGLVVNNSVSGLPQYYTFVLDSAARFYDPGTGASWPVYPSDVMFSLIRTMAFLNLPSQGTYNGWIIGQALLNKGNLTWDNGIHAPYNNTPQNILSAMLVNNSQYCPTIAMTQDNGCITFNVNGNHQSWPYFLNLIEDPLGSSITPCGWFTAQGATVPGFTGTSAARGDGPCLLPGGVKTTSASQFQSYLDSQGPTSWDAFEELAETQPTYAPQPGVQWAAVGSGPYYLAFIQKSIGYVLKSNPAYTAPTGCAGQAGCEPPAGGYIGQVNVFWEPSDAQGIAEYKAGQADSAGIDSTDTDILKSLQAGGFLDYGTPSATLSIGFMPLDMDFNLGTAKGLDPGGQINVPETFFSNIAVRNLITTSYPYTTINTNVNNNDGIEYAFNYGGAIPIGMGNYYPTNISWPDSDPTQPSTVNGSAAWWWAQGTTPGSPYYSSALAACSTGSPCYFPVFGEQGSPALTDAITYFISSIEKITDNAIQPNEVDLSFAELLQESFVKPGTSGLTVWNLGWAPDYPDPTDYMLPMYYPNASFTYGDSVYQSLVQSEFMSPTCGHLVNTSYASLTYWANQSSIPQKCQGIAYLTMEAWMNIAASNTNVTSRILQYNLVEHIANDLALYIYTSQGNAVPNWAPWINPDGINSNPVIGGGGDQPFYQWKYVAGLGSLTVSESGLSSGTSWSVTVGGLTQAGNTTSFAPLTLAQGTYTYTVGYVPGYAITSESTGTITVEPSTAETLLVTFSPISQPTYPLIFIEQGLATGSSTWYVNVTGLGLISSKSTVITFFAPVGSYSYWAEIIPGYNATNQSETISLAAPGLTTIVTYSSPISQTWSVTLIESGLPSGVTWTAGVNGFNQTSNTTTMSFYTYLGNYTFYVAPSGAFVPNPNVGGVATYITGDNKTIGVSFAASGSSYLATFVETGLPAGTTWSATVGGTLWSSNNGTILVPLANGDYPYSIGTVPGYTVTNATGTLTINDAPTSLSFKFSPNYVAKYGVTFGESGLPSGTSWSVSVAGTPYSSSTSSVSLSLANGTYAWSIPVVSGVYRATPSSGTLTVAGLAQSVSVTFSNKFTYSATFTETGLPTGTTWGLEIDGGSYSATAPNTIVVGLANNTYAYTATTADPSAWPWVNSSATVNGAPLAVTVPFVEAYALTFSESGLASGKTWSVSVGAVTKTAAAPSNIVFWLTNGAYSYSIGAVSGYTTKNTTGSGTISNAPVSVSVAWTANTSTTSSTSLPWLYIAIGVGIAVVVIVVVLFAMRRNRGAYAEEEPMADDQGAVMPEGEPAAEVAPEGEAPAEAAPEEAPPAEEGADAGAPPSE